jgi:hypothetical protein
MFNQYLKQLTVAAITTILIISQGFRPSNAQESHEHHHHQQHQGIDQDKTQTLPPMPTNLPKWMDNVDKNHIYRKRGEYNDDIYNVRPLALDLNAVAVGHAFAYEDLVTGKAQDLESKTFERINTVLKNPPRFMPDEANISPTFGRKYGVLEQVFDWTHILHAQTVDVLASTQLTDAEKEAEIDRLYKFYIDNVPYAITGLPMNMGYLDAQTYSKAFRNKYPKVNGLFWGYHWLQGSMYDLLYGKNLEEQRQDYQEIGKQYHEVELYRTDRSFMPMFAAQSPRFAQRFPEIANTFDNLHMLHDMVNDILASDWISEAEKEQQIKRGIWMVMAANHEGMQPGKTYGADKLHDHRFMEGMPGMGWMGDIEGVNHNHEDQDTNMMPDKDCKMSSEEGQENHMNHNHEGHDPNMMPDKDCKMPSEEGEENHRNHNHQQQTPNSQTTPAN